MKKIIVSFIFLIFISCGSNGSAADALRIMPLGDSITQGCTVEITDSGYREKLEDLLTAASITFDYVGSQTDSCSTITDKDHEGHGGYFIDDGGGGAATDLADNVYSWLQSNPADIILFTGGSNGICQGGPIAPADAIVDMGTLLDNINSYESDYNLPITVFIFTMPHRSSCKTEADQFNVLLKSMAETRRQAGDRVFIIDSESQFVYYDDMVSSTNVHPSATGFTKMANKAYGALNCFLGPIGRIIN